MDNMLTLSVSLSPFVGLFRYYVGRIYIKTGLVGIKAREFYFSFLSPKAGKIPLPFADISLFSCTARMSVSCLSPT